MRDIEEVTTPKPSGPLFYILFPILPIYVQHIWTSKMSKILKSHERFSNT